MTLQGKRGQQAAEATRPLSLLTSSKSQELVERISANELLDRKCVPEDWDSAGWLVEHLTPLQRPDRELEVSL